MPDLTRRRYKERRDCWYVYYSDVCVGTIARRAGCPVDVDQWEWGCGFYPGTEPGQDENGTAADFEAAWRRLLPNLPRPASRNGATRGTGRPVNMPCGREARGCRLRSQIALCLAHAGLPLIATTPAGSYVHRGHIYAAQAADGIRR
jgi:hypothetical protein